MSAQDDEREREMRTLFNLIKPEDFGRSDIDAALVLKGSSIPDELRGTKVMFELKSTTSGRPTFSTVRDFGPHHIEKWRDLHWLFGIYDRNRHGDMTLQYCLYGSPQRMKPWFDIKADYIAPDLALARLVPELITDSVAQRILGDAEVFDLTDAQRLMKNQYTANQYRAAADIDRSHYSRHAMLRLLRERCRYVIRRGSTLNNPHIPATFFAGWERITEDHAARLRELVVEALAELPSGLAA